jgi:hypothetical protein
MRKKKTPPVDIRKVIRAAAEAALEEPAASPKPKPKKRRLSTGRAVILGAGLVTAGRLAASARDSNVVSSLQERLDDLGVKLRPDVDNEDVDEVVDEELPEEPEEEVEEEAPPARPKAPAARGRARRPRRA